MHAGHFHISNTAIKALQLKQIWWLVSTQNPLKSKFQKKTVIKRLEKIKEINKNYKTFPMTLELKHKTFYSYDIIYKLKKRFPNVNFFWIIGADNLLILHKWNNWKKIFYMCPIVVFDRPNYFYKSINSKAAKYFFHNRVNLGTLKNVKKYDLPKWAFVKIKLDYNASSDIRKKERI